MPVEFLSDEQAAVYGSFVGEPALAELERFFYLEDADRDLVAKRRSDSHRLGFAVQLGTVRAVGRFLEDPSCGTTGELSSAVEAGAPSGEASAAPERREQASLVLIG